MHRALDPAPGGGSDGGTPTGLNSAALPPLLGRLLLVAPIGDFGRATLIAPSDIFRFVALAFGEVALNAPTEDLRRLVIGTIDPAEAFRLLGGERLLPSEDFRLLLLGGEEACGGENAAVSRDGESGVRDDGGVCFGE